MDDGENKRGKWGLDLGVEDTVTGTRRPTAGLSGGELFQASLALALGLADAVMNQSAGVRVDALFIDEGFGSLDETSVERAIDLLDELRDRGAMVGVITHVPALLDALPLGVRVVEATNGQGSTIQQSERST
jgi:exonuclease SbcC